MRDAETLDDLIATGRAKWAGSPKRPSRGRPSRGRPAAGGPDSEPPRVDSPLADSPLSTSATEGTGATEGALWSFDGLSGHLVEVACGKERGNMHGGGPAGITSGGPAGITSGSPAGLAGGGPAGLTGAAQIVLDAQRSGEPCAWIAVGPSLVFPPDLADQGIDLDALPIVRVERIEQAWSAADELLRPGGFGLCVIDEADADPTTATKPPATPLSVQVRLAALARHHRAVLLWLRSAHRSGQDPIGQAGLRLAATRTRSSAGALPTDDEHDMRFRCELRVLRHKKAGSLSHRRTPIALDRDGSVGIA